MRFGLKVYLGPNLFHRQRFLFKRGVMGLKWEIGLSRMIEVKKNFHLGLYIEVL